MGTSGAYGGSVGPAWSNARQEASALADAPSADAAADVAGSVLGAVAADAAAADAAGVARPGVGSSLRLPGGLGGGGAGGGGSSGGGAGGGGRGGSAGGGRRGRQRISVAGGAALAAGAALRAGNSDALQAAGLDLAQLRGLDAFDQVGEIVNAIIPDTGTIEDNEVRGAASEALLTMLDDGVDEPADAVRTIVTEYVFAMCMTELGDTLRRGDRPAVDGRRAEQELKDAIRAHADGLTITPRDLTPQGFSDTIADVYGEVEDLMA